MKCNCRICKRADPNVKEVLVATFNYPNDCCVQAYVAYPFAIYHGFDYFSSKYVITHMPTGYGIPFYLSNIKSAFSALKDLQTLDLDWEISDPEELVEKYRDKISPLINKYK